MLMGKLMGESLGLIFGWLAIRRQGIYFSMITLALAQMLFFVALQAKFTGGEDGLQGVARGKLFGVIDLSNDLVMYYVALVIVALAFLLIVRTIHSPFGQVLKAIKENEPRAISLGYDVNRFKLLAFVISAALTGLAGSGLVTDAQADVTVGAYFEQREIQTALFKTADFVSKVNITDADIEAFYKNHQALFHVPEQATIEYVVLNLDSVKKSIVATDAVLKDYFQQNLERFAGKEERKARHILIAAPKDASAASRKEARAKAEQVLADVRKAPNSFPELAKKYSQDPGSATNGGDLGFFSRGAMVKPFEDAVFALNKGDVSDVVESDFGFHIIQLTDIKAPQQRSFEDARPMLEAEYRQQQSQKQFAEKAEAFTNAVYEQADSLKPTAERLGLQVQTATVGVEPAPGASGALGSKRFLEALFSPESLEKKRNTEAVEIGPNHLAAGRVVKHSPAHTQNLADIKDKVRQLAIQEKAAAMAKTEGTAKLAHWKANPASAVVAAPVVVSRSDARGQHPKVVDAALKASTETLPAFVGADLGSDGFAVVKVGTIVPRTGTQAADAARDRGIYAQAWNSAEVAAYYENLKERMQTQILVPRPAEKSLTP